MSDTDHRKAKQVGPEDAEPNASPDENESAPVAEEMDAADLARLQSNFAPLPSVLGVTFSLI